MARGFVGGARRAPFVVSRGERRKTIWAASADVTGETTLAAGAAVLDQSLTEAQLQTIGLPLTITRTRGILLVRSDQVANNEVPFGALGMSVVSEQARAAGVASIPTPITEEASDLFFTYQHWVTQNRLSSAIGFSQSTTIFEFDSKAQRVVQSGEAIIITMENGSATAGVDFLLKFRMLLKLH